jgi:hypothetical protein
MVSNDRNRIVTHRLLDENTADKRGNPLSLKSFVTFVPFVVRNSGSSIDHGFILNSFAARLKTSSGTPKATFSATS